MFSESAFKSKVFAFNFKHLRSSHLGFLSRILCLAIVVFQAGCAVGNYGSLLTRYTHTNTATVMDVFSLGAQLRTFAPDRGATLGYRHSSYIFVKNSNAQNKNEISCLLSFPWKAVSDKSQPRTEWCLFESPPIEAEMLTRASTSTGIEIQYTKELKRLNLGYLDQALTIGPEPGESVVYKLDYKRNKPEKTQVFFKRYKEGDKP